MDGIMFDIISCPVFDDTDMVIYLNVALKYHTVHQLATEKRINRFRWSFRDKLKMMHKIFGKILDLHLFGVYCFIYKAVFSVPQQTSLERILTDFAGSLKERSETVQGAID